MSTQIPPELTQLIGEYLKPKMPKYTIYSSFDNGSMYVFNDFNEIIEYVKTKTDGSRIDLDVIWDVFLTGNVHKICKIKTSFCFTGDFYDRRKCYKSYIRIYIFKNARRIAQQDLAHIKEQTDIQSFLIESGYSVFELIGSKSYTLAFKFDEKLKH